ncbi:probable G-protein coupled receptor 63 isoform X1 [Ornithorhynchus anatinus]|uniref:G protein-coupled receptor 63 n=2 Tax=Ornithorhynchus anatinus TaxID=9258 RepID=A0A6I8PEN7_ORNAN|nr:probable G-protein coupled receptor 63 isoform X1 [Ornithorhynchus anatinus]XP_028903417.1 probable G-protein coupled receptor 63 isoform X1 [Ornithorhynchus anatinus]
MVFSAGLAPSHPGAPNTTFVVYENAYLNFTTPPPFLHPGPAPPLRHGSEPVAATEMRTPVINGTSAPSPSEVFKSLNLPLQVLLSALMVFILLVSFLGNLVVCLMVYQKAAMRSAINILLANLAFADMLLAVLNMPFALVTVLTTRWIFGDAFCRVSAMFFWLFVMEGVAILLVISIDRFLIIVQRQDKLNPHRAKVLIAVSWATSFCVAFPLAAGNPDLQVPSRAPQCVFGYTTQPGYRAYVVLVVLVSFFIPFLVMLYSFLAILNTVRHNAVRIHNYPDGICLSQAGKLGLMSLQRPFQVNIDMSFKTRAFTTILILFAVFIVCWAPFTAYSLVATFDDRFYSGRDFFEISAWLLWLCYLKSALNPLIYYWRIKKFHDACLDLMPRYFKFFPQLPGHTRRRIRPSAIYVCGEHRTVVRSALIEPAVASDRGAFVCC